MRDLGSELEQYAESDFYPFHMPGHKRRFDPGFDAYSVDITEIEPFDDLHYPQGILKELQEECAGFFGAKESFYLVNGSTCGILSAITAVMDTGEYYLILDRGSHKAAYNAVILRDIIPEYVFSEESEQGFYEGVYPQDVDNLLKKRQRNSRELEKKTLKPCLFVTSPTYDGITSDIRSLSELIHEHDGMVIVDEAHGAHFGMHDVFPESAVKEGADIVIQSLHKTLPSPTQTSVLHICSDRAKTLDIAKYRGIFESSSPSYILMSGISSCINFLDSEGKKRFEDFAGRLEKFYEKTGSLKHLRVYYDEYERGKRDISKILIGVGSSGLTGHELYGILAERYHLRLEMEAQFYVTALSSVMDSDEGFDRLADALLELDAQLSEKSNEKLNEKLNEELSEEFQNFASCNAALHNRTEFPTCPYPKPVVAQPMGESFRARKESIPLDSAEGRVSGAFVYLYPPGIPVLAPGELVTDEIIGLIKTYKNAGLSVRGIGEERDFRLEVCLQHTEV